MTVRDRYPGFYPPSDEELQDLWTNGLIVTDANTLLNLYRYSNETRAEFVEVLRSNSDRLWLPHQVGLEFQENRLPVIEQQRTAYDSVSKVIKEAGSKVVAELQTHKKHSSMAADKFIEEYNKATQNILIKLQKLRDTHVETEPSRLAEDYIWTVVTQLFKGKIGEPFLTDKLEQVYSEGRIRFAAKTPPGYRDEQKGEPRCYGDLVLWKQLLEHAQQVQAGALFVTDDGKEDWWRISYGQTIGPRVELVDEYLAASGKRIHFYSPDQFLRYAKDRLSASVSDTSLGEVQRVSSEQASDYTIKDLIVERNALMNRQRDLQYLLNHSDYDSQDDDLLSDLREQERRYNAVISKLREDRARHLEGLATARRLRFDEETGLTDMEMVESMQSRHEENIAHVDHAIAAAESDLRRVRESRLQYGGNISFERGRGKGMLQREIREVRGALEEINRTLDHLGVKSHIKDSWR